MDALLSANFKNRGAATFFKDITTIGALLILAVRARTPNKESRIIGLAVGG